MDKDWIKAVTLLCIIAQNNADSMKRSVRYAKIMKKEYGLDAEKFQRIYDSWFCSGEIQEKYRIKDSVTGREQKLPLYHKGVDGMCRMLEEGIIDEKEFFEIFWETPYETLKENERYTGFYPSLPGCIASAEGKNQLKEEMRTALKKWIRSAFYMWRENNILEEWSSGIFCIYISDMKKREEAAWLSTDVLWLMYMNTRKRRREATVDL